MIRRTFALTVAAVTLFTMSSVGADAPAPELGVLNPDVAKVVSAPCAAESAFDVPYGHPSEEGIMFPDYVKVRDDFYAENCTRLKITFGPIVMKPGQNDVLIQPVTFEKPMYDGYLTRFKPDMVGATQGFASPRVKDAHLHHGTWLNPGYFGSSAEYFNVAGQQIPNPGRTYGRGPWIASGEEKTVAIWPEGYGLKIKQSDAWLFLHMIHNATAQPDVVYVTYDLDYIPAAAAEEINPETNLPFITNTQGIWLDVGDCSWSSACEKDAFNPIFNVQRGFNAAWDPSLHRLDGACTFPAENCSTINTLAEKSAQQGVRLEQTPYDEITVSQDGTLVMMGGHLHNGGLWDDVSIVRDPHFQYDTTKNACVRAKDESGNDLFAPEATLIHRSDAYYFDHNFDFEAPGALDAIRNDPSVNLVGAPPVSWDFVMTGVTADLGWKVKVNACDRIRLEGVYDSTIASWYEQMGIVMAWFVPLNNWTGGEAAQVDALDPFDPNVEINFGLNARAVQPGEINPGDLPGTGGSCTFGEEVDGKRQLCVRGQMTHPRIETSSDHNNTARSPLNITGGYKMNEIPIGGFGYGPADNGIIRGTGMIPEVALGESVTFWNADTADYMWHTVTRCESPCTGPTTASYPIADGAWDDILENGVTPEEMSVLDIDGNTHVVPAGSDVNWLLANVGPDPMDFDSGQIGIGTGANNKVDWVFTPTRTGLFSFYCRIHPPMRGAIRVVDPA